MNLETMAPLSVKLKQLYRQTHFAHLFKDNFIFNVESIADVVGSKLIIGAKQIKDYICLRRDLL